MKLDLLTNATVVEDAISFVSQKSKDKEKLKSHSEDKDHLEEEQEKETGEIISTTNQVF
jgi:hypothetical protein